MGYFSSVLTGYYNRPPWRGQKENVKEENFSLMLVILPLRLDASVDEGTHGFCRP